MYHRRAVALLLILVLAGLSALGHATPPDPAWIPGVYDDADGDDVVAIVTSWDLALGALAVEDGRAFWTPVAAVEVARAAVFDSAIRPAFEPFARQRPRRSRADAELR